MVVSAAHHHLGVVQVKMEEPMTIVGYHHLAVGGKMEMMMKKMNRHSNHIHVDLVAKSYIDSTMRNYLHLLNNIMLLMHIVLLPGPLGLDTLGVSKPIKMTIINKTTNTSTNVNPSRNFFFCIHIMSPPLN